MKDAKVSDLSYITKFFRLLSYFDNNITFILIFKQVNNRISEQQVLQVVHESSEFLLKFKSKCQNPNAMNNEINMLKMILVVNWSVILAAFISGYYSVTIRFNYMDIVFATCWCYGSHRRLLISRINVIVSRHCLSMNTYILIVYLIHKRNRISYMSNGYA